MLYRERYAVFLERIALYPDIIAFYWQKETIFSAQFCAVYSRKLSDRSIARAIFAKVTQSCIIFWESRASIRLKNDKIVKIEYRYISISWSMKTLSLLLWKIWTLPIHILCLTLGILFALPFIQCVCVLTD